ncbi:MAG: hypothetical protein DRJ09_13360, partial [Bacteroidetes bacterium]
ATEDEYAPKICVDGQNNTLVTWERPVSPHTQVVLQKIEPDGTLTWGSQGITYQAGTQDYTGPVAIGLSDDSFIVAFYKQTGPSYSPTRHVYAQKFDASGTAVWSSDAAISTAGGISAWTNLEVSSDDSDGILVGWVDDRNNDMQLQGFVQHVNCNGTIAWSPNGEEVADQGTFNHENVRIIGVNSGGKVVVAWDKYNGNQSQIAIQGQKFSATGAQLWGSTGQEFVPMTQTTANIIGGAMDGENALIAYEEYIGGGTVNRAVKAFSVDENGNFNWAPAISDMSTRVSEKLHEAYTTIYNDQFIVVWEDSDTQRDIYMQNIFTDGHIGFPGLSDDATLSDLTVNNVTVDGFNPDTLHYDVGIPAGNPFVTGATASDSNAVVTITQAPAVPGQSTVVVLAEDSVTTLTYTIDFHVAGTDATLSDLTVNGTTIANFNPDTLYYEYVVPNGDPIPVVAGVTTDPLATLITTQAISPDGTATLEVTSEDGNTTQTYTVYFYYLGNDATLSDLTINGVTIENFDPLTTYYEYDVPEGNSIPVLDGTPTDSTATKIITQADTVPGDGFIEVTAADSVTQMTYQVHFNLITSVKTLPEKVMAVYPNPAGGELWIKNVKGYNKIEVCSVSGKCFKLIDAGTGNRIDISELHPDIYFLKISLPEGKVFVTRFVKE